MKSFAMMGCCGALFLTLAAGGVARAEPVLHQQAERGQGSLELGLQGTVVGSGGEFAGTFVGPVLTLQGSHYRPFAAVFQLGVGAGLDDDPADPESTRVGAQAWVALGARLRPLAFGRRGPPRLELFVGPLVGVLVNPAIVILTAAAEVGVAYHVGRVRLSLALHGGWADIMHQAVPDRLKASWCGGGQLSAGLTF